MPREFYFESVEKVGSVEKYQEPFISLSPVSGGRASRV